MKILFISNLYPPLALGGYEQACRDVAHAFEEKGHVVCVLTSAFRARQLLDPEERVWRLLKLETNWNLADIGPTPWVSRSRFEIEWHNTRVVQRSLARLKPEIVVVWNGANLGRALFVVAEESLPVIFYLSDGWLKPHLRTGSDRPRQALPRRVRNHLLRNLGMPVEGVRAKWRVYCSGALKKEYAGTNSRIGREYVVHHGVSANWFSANESRLRSQDRSHPQRILFSGRICPEKGVTTLIRAFEHVRKVPGLEQTRLSVLGVSQDRDYSEHVLRLVSQLGLDDAIDFQPPKARREMGSVYAGHDLLVFPSEWEEPFALTLLEAMAAGLPLVSTLTGGSAEILRPGANCLTFDAGDSNALARSVAWALQHTAHMESLAATAREDVRERYTLKQQTASLERVCQEVLSERKDAERGRARDDAMQAAISGEP